jgi:hypothetical protein
MPSQSEKHTSYGFYPTLKLSVGGGVVFWATTIAISLLPIAAEYRAAFLKRSWSIQTVWIDSLPMGMIIGGCLSYCMLRYFDKIPTQNPILKSLIASLIALGVAILLVDVPSSYLFLEPRNALHYFLIGVMLNAPRFLLLGLTIGYLCEKRAHSHHQGVEK